MSWALLNSGAILCIAGQNGVSSDGVLHVLLVWVGFFFMFVCFLISISIPYFPLDLLATRTTDHEILWRLFRDPSEKNNCSESGCCLYFSEA